MQRKAKRAAWVAAAALAWACDVTPPPSVWVTVPEGMPVAELADSLEARGVVASARRFERFARVSQRHLGIQPGTYPLRLHSPMGAVLAALRRGTEPVVRVQVPAGANLRELAEHLSRATGHPPEAFLEAATDPDLRTATGTRGPTVEGYLFPTTYRFPEGALPLELLAIMVDTFDGRWRPEWDRRLAALEIDRHQAVVLASIVEGEGPHEEDWHQVAAVYHNRLLRGMRLQADPTVVYSLGERRRLVFRDYEIDSPYNTYRINGLPPGPINQPSTRALEAALYPADTDHLYFVARPDGRHVFSRTYAEHLAATRRARRTPDSGARPNE